MRLPFAPEFLVERQAYALKHCCEDCVLFNKATEECAHGWPNEAHRRSYYETPQSDIVFCKEFELL
jgi:hypothetical protein